MKDNTGHENEVTHLPLTSKISGLFWAKAAITCIEPPRIEHVVMLNLDSTNEVGMDAQRNLSSARDCKTCNSKPSCTSGGPIGGSIEVLVEYGNVCFHLQRIREVQGRLESP